MRNLYLLIKPASSACNLRCVYCFYTDVSANRHVSNYGMMSRDIAEAVIKRALTGTRRVTFGFQGGEPTLWGIERFRFFVEAVNRLNTGGAEIRYALQTNGILLNEEWADFFKEHGFLIGLSLDGYKELHDSNRVDAAGQSCFGKVIRAAALLRKAKAEFNILSVVTSKSASHAEKLYRFYQSQNFGFLQFIPCIDDFESAGSSLSAAQYGSFLKTMFDLWYRDRMAGRDISIRFFDDLMGMYKGYPPQQCSMNGSCPVQFTVESDGGVYPCDFYVLDKWRLGNVRTAGFEAMLTVKEARQFIAESLPVNEECAHCHWYRLCRGGCKRDREPILNGMPHLNRFCEAYKDFFGYSYERFAKLCTRFSR